MVKVDAIQRRFECLLPTLDERRRRLMAAAESLAIGYGGISRVARATGVSRRAIARGIAELSHAPGSRGGGAIRKPGAGRKRTVEQDATLVRDLEALIEPLSRGDPESPLRWTCKSLRNLARELGHQGHRVSHRLVAELLHELGYSLQANAKTREGASHPDRNAQFEHIHGKVQGFLSQGQPVISVDTKKKELVGNFKNGGRELRPKGDPEQVRVHDFVIPELGRATPYGVYDVGKNRGSRERGY
jgi:transposase